MYKVTGNWQHGWRTKGVAGSGWQYWACRQLDDSEAHWGIHKTGEQEAAQSDSSAIQAPTNVSLPTTASAYPITSIQT